MENDRIAETREGAAAGDSRTVYTFRADDTGLAACLDRLSDEFASPRPKIIVDEIASNIVRCSGAASFDLAVVREAGETRLVFSDDGRPFDPTRAADPDVSAPLRDRPVGGLGLFMVRKMSKALSYAYENGRNVLSVTLKDAT